MTPDRPVQCCNSGCTNIFYLPRNVPGECRQCEECTSKRKSPVEPLPQLTCRKCEAVNPMVYFAPVVVDGAGTCVCFDCAKERNWTTPDGDLRPGVTL